MQIPIDPASFRYGLMREWGQLHADILAAFEAAPFPAAEGFRFFEDTSFDDFYGLSVFAERKHWKAKAMTWQKREDYRRLQDWENLAAMKNSFHPTLSEKEEVLSAEDNASIRLLFDALISRPEPELLLRDKVLLLDGSRFVLQVFREGKLQRLFRWDSAVEELGPMQWIARFQIAERLKQKAGKENQAGDAARNGLKS